MLEEVLSNKELAQGAAVILAAGYPFLFWLLKDERADRKAAQKSYTDLSTRVSEGFQTIGTALVAIRVMLENSR